MSVESATARYIDSLGAANLEKAAAYTNGNHWILLWNLVVAGLVTWLIVKWGLLDRIEARIGERRRGLQAFVVGLVYFLVSALLTLPWTIYASWYRETGYGRTSQPIADFLMQSTLSTVITSVIGALLLTGVYWLIRRTGKRWWLWSGGLVAGALAFIILLSPVLIEPLFNKYQPVPQGEVRDAVVEMAGRAGIPPEKIYMFDGSRQSNNFTANAGGVGNTARVAISDVALKSASLDEVRAVTGHEIGHYVLKHTWYGIAFYSIAAIVLFWLADRLFPRVAHAFGSSANVGDPRGLPVLMFIGTAFMLLVSPLFNSFARTIEVQADQYSLETENKPDGLASALVKTAEYRYPRPGKLEEIIFYTHPSVENRVRRAMQWKADHSAAATAK
jgi:STE24 endopeptidase